MKKRKEGETKKKKKKKKKKTKTIIVFIGTPQERVLLFQFHPLLKKLRIWKSSFTDIDDIVDELIPHSL